MEFEHPIFLSAEDYEEYHQIMNEMAAAAERNIPDPQPGDLGIKNNEYIGKKILAKSEC